MKRFLILSALFAMLCGCCNVDDIESNNNGSTIDSNTNTDNNQGNGNTGGNNTGNDTNTDNNTNQNGNNQNNGNNGNNQGNDNTSDNNGGNQESDTVVLNGCTYTKDMKTLLSANEDITNVTIPDYSAEEDLYEDNDETEEEEE